MNNLEDFYEKVEKDFMNEKDILEKYYIMECYDKLKTLKTFKIYKLWIKNESISSHVSYFPIKTCEQSILYYDFPNEITTIKETINHVFELLWKFKMCNECFYLVNHDKTICDYCLMSQFYWSYGLTQKIVDSIPTCSICLESVYKSKLECGHYFQKTCLIKMIPSYYYENQEIKCPLCRQLLTKLDKIEYFFI
jgi:hypothetical protein